MVFCVQMYTVFIFVVATLVKVDAEVISCFEFLPHAVI